MAPPTGKDAKDTGKQKTLFGFFAKGQPQPQVQTPQPKKTAPPSRSNNNAPSSPVSVQTKTPSSNFGNSSPITTASVKSSSSNAATDAAIDVDALRLDATDDQGSDDEGEAKVVANRRKSLKRKIVVQDDDEEEDVDLDAFTQRLSQFKKSDARRTSDASSSGSTSRPRKTLQRKKPRRGSAASEDDDFIVPSDEDEQDDEDNAPSRSGSSAKSGSGMDVDSDEDDDGPPKKKQVKSKKAKPTASARPSDAATPLMGGTANMFLTAAEQRAQTTKKDKKEAEECYSFLKDIRDKDGIRQDQPGYDPRTLYIPKTAWGLFTPFEKQFWEIKQNHWDTVLFFQKGKFYELYENDAQIGHTEFDLKLTDRVKMKMVGVPESSFDLWAGKFLAKGYKVGKVDQAETSLGAEMRVAAAAKGKSKSAAPQKEKIVRRELSKVLTTGTLVDGNMLTDEQAGHCVSLRELDEEDTFGVCILDASTGEFNLCSFVDDACRTKLETIMRQLRPKELVYMKGNLSVPTMRLLKTILPSSCLWTALRKSESLTYEETLTALEEMFPATQDGDNQEMESDDNPPASQSGLPESIRRMLDCKTAVEAIGAMVWYLRTLKLDRDLLTMKNFNIYDPMKQGLGLVLDGQTLAHIEVLQNSEGTDEGSLLKLLGRCITPFGKRLFRIWLCMPLRDVKDINARLDVVEALMNDEDAQEKFTSLAKGLPDLERIVSRIHAGTCKVRDFLKVLKSFQKLSEGIQRLGDHAESIGCPGLSGLLRSAPVLDKHLKHLLEQFDEQDDQLMPKPGKDEPYDEVEEEISEVKEELESTLTKLTKKTGAKKMEYWHSAIGTKEVYLVQTTPTQKVPKEWTKASATKAVVRYNVPELAQPIRRYKEAQENRNTAIRNFKLRVYADFDADREVWLQTIKVVAELDCLFGLAKASRAIGEPACRPELVESEEAFVEFEDLRHPALCLKNDFIPNNVNLGGGVPGIMLLTGANMAGKSTMMRMTAAGVIMAQMGMYVPAEKARISPCDTILTRMGAYDNMFSNASTFRVEMDEACKILRSATPKSLIILDELGRGTSTFDGMAIAGSVLHQLATHTLGLSLFATHYSSLTEEFIYHPNIRNMHMKTAVDDEKRELVFLYQLTEGIASSSFGTHVASLAGVPSGVVARAEAISKDFALQFQKKMESRRTSKMPLVEQADFAYLWKLAHNQLSLDENPVRQHRVLDLIRTSAVGSYGRSAMSVS